MEGFVIIDKPCGITSHDVVDVIRKKFGMRRVGHAGTLDPLATGVLIILVGTYTKFFEKFMGMDKAYRATLILGQKTTSADIQGKILSTAPFEHLSVEQIEETFRSFVGEIDQVPPMVSAVKMGGKKLYELARKGVIVERQARRVMITKLEIENMQVPRIKFYLECSKGTYVRQLAEDIGEKLGCGACISQIQRTKVGSYTIDKAVSLEEVNENHIRHW